MSSITVKGLELKGLRERLKDLLRTKKPGVKVGVLDGATYSEGPAAGEYVAQILAHHEFGTATIPARAPFRSTIDKKKADWSREAAAYLKASAGKIALRAALTQIGDVVAMDIQQAFEDGLPPALNPATIRRKEKMGYGAHASTPVMLTGTAQRSIKSEYVEDVSRVGSE